MLLKSTLNDKKVASEAVFRKGLEKGTKKTPLNLENDAPVYKGALFSLFQFARKSNKNGVPKKPK